jgi:hypothetical protein
VLEILNSFLFRGWSQKINQEMKRRKNENTKRNRNGKWDIVNMTELMKDGTWMSGMNLITSIEDVVERADKENVPIITRKYLETKIFLKEMEDK